MKETTICTWTRLLNNSKIVISDKKIFCSCLVEFFFEPAGSKRFFFHFGLVWRLNFLFGCDCIILSIWFFRYGCFQPQNFNIFNEKAWPSHNMSHAFLLFWVIFYETIVLCCSFFNMKVIWWDRYNASLSKNSFAICDSTIHSIILLVLKKVKTFIKTFKVQKKNIELCAWYFAYLYYKMAEYSTKLWPKNRSQRNSVI